MAMLRRLTGLLTLSVLLPAIATISCGRSGNRETVSENGSHAMPDTLRVVTLYSPASYFIYRGQEMGYDYELVTALAVDKDLI